MKLKTIRAELYIDSAPVEIEMDIGFEPTGEVLFCWSEDVPSPSSEIVYQMHRQAELYIATHEQIQLPRGDRASDHKRQLQQGECGVFSDRAFATAEDESSK